MSPDQMINRPRTGAPSRTIRHLYLRTDAAHEGTFAPLFYVEARIDLADVRSGVSESINLTRALDIIPVDGDTLWTEDMVHAIDPDLIERRRPRGARLLPLPDFVDRHHLSWVESQFLSYLLRYFEVRVYFNRALNLYSAIGESREDFRSRCEEALEESFRRDLDNLREVFERRIERCKERHLKSERWDDLDQDGLTTQVRNRIHETSERIADLFLKAELGRKPADRPQPGQPGNELSELLASIEAEASEAARRLTSEYVETAGILDEHAVRPSLKDVHVGGASILWLPVQAGR